MDENSREEETSEAIENAVSGEKTKKTEKDSKFFPKDHVVINVTSEITENEVSDRCGSSFNASDTLSGPSNFSPFNHDAEDRGMDTAERTNEQNEIPKVCSRVSSLENQTDSQPHVRIAPDVVESKSRKGSIGPPPSYSFVMKQKRKAPKPTSPEPLVTERLPPPNYGGVRGLYMTPEDERLERCANLPSFLEPIWRSHSQPALCPRCGILVLTTTHSHDSIATHVAALALCLFGCWPCCLLPYCMNVCKNTYHHCPICQCFLGAYSPW